MPAPQGFEYRTRADGTVVITHQGRAATTLRAGRAADFLVEVDDADADGGQEIMARWTGQYRHGNERAARQHPRNAGR